MINKFKEINGSLPILFKISILYITTMFGSFKDISLN